MWEGRPAARSAMQLAFDDASARMAARWAEDDSGRAARVRTPSRSMCSVPPPPARLAMAAADVSLDRTRALMGTAWTNRLAALLPASGWSVGSCAGDDDGRAAARYEPACFDRIECTRLRAIRLRCTRETSWLVSLDLVTENDDEGARRHAHGRPDDPHDVEFEAFGSELGPGEHVVGVHGFYSGAHIYSLMFELSSGRTLGGGRVLWRGLLPPNRSPFSFAAPAGACVRALYGRVARQPCHISGLGVIFGPAEPVAWSPGPKARFSDVASAKAGAVLSLAEDPRNVRFGTLPTPVVVSILGFALALFDAS